MRCKSCGQALHRLMVLAMLEDAGCTVLPSANVCPRSEDGEHDFGEPSEDADEFARKADAERRYDMKPENNDG